MEEKKTVALCKNARRKKCEETVGEFYWEQNTVNSMPLCREKQISPFVEKPSWFGRVILLVKVTTQ